MYRRVWAALAVLSLSLSGCTYVARDLRYPGGAVGGVLDNRMFDASGSKQLNLLRYAILVDMVARGGSVYSRDPRESEAYVDYMVSAAEELNVLAGDIYQLDQVYKFNGAPIPQLACEVPMHGPVGAKPEQTDDELLTKVTALAASASTNAQTAAYSARLASNSASAANTSAIQAAQSLAQMQAGAPGALAAQPAPALAVMSDETADNNQCLSYRVNFESDAPMMEKRIFRLAMAALPQKQAKQFLDQVTSGNLLSAVTAAFSFSVKALDGLHSGAAVHRTGLELVARQNEECNLKAGTKEVISAYMECLHLSDTQLFVGKTDKRDSYFEGVRPQAFLALMRNLRDSCRMIPISIDDPKGDLNAVREERIEKCNQIEFLPRSRWQTKSQLDAVRASISGLADGAPFDSLGA